MTFQTNYPGIGLPTAVYNYYVYLLNQAFSNSFTCTSGVGGYCVSSKPCNQTFSKVYSGQTPLNFSLEISWNTSTVANQSAITNLLMFYNTSNTAQCQLMVNSVNGSTVVYGS